MYILFDTHIHMYIYMYILYYYINIRIGLWTQFLFLFFSWMFQASLRREKKIREQGDSIVLTKLNECTRVFYKTNKRRSISRKKGMKFKTKMLILLH